MVSFVVAMNRVDVVALNTIFALRLSKTGRTVGRTDSRLDGWSVGRTDEQLVGKIGPLYRPFPFYPVRFLSIPIWIERQMASLHMNDASGIIGNRNSKPGKA